MHEPPQLAWISPELLRLLHKANQYSTCTHAFNIFELLFESNVYLLEVNHEACFTACITSCSSRLPVRPKLRLKCQ
jgi:hypothetical protein